MPSETKSRAAARRLRRRHEEPHFTASETVHDIVLGMADGLTVPFALAAGLSGAMTPSHIVVMAGLAEIVAGSISMGLGGFLAARSDAEHYHKERCREVREVKEIPEEERAEVADVFRKYGLTSAQIEPILNNMERDHKNWVDFMMRFELGLDKPEPNRELWSAITIALSYAFAGFVPLAPYMLIKEAHTALLVSTAVTLFALFVFGFVKARIIGSRPFYGAFQMLIVGGLAAGAAFLLAKLVS